MVASFCLAYFRYFGDWKMCLCWFSQVRSMKIEDQKRFGFIFIKLIQFLAYITQFWHLPFHFVQLNKGSISRPGAQRRSLCWPFQFLHWKPSEGYMLSTVYQSSVSDLYLLDSVEFNRRGSIGRPTLVTYIHVLVSEHARVPSVWRGTLNSP